MNIFLLPKPLPVMQVRAARSPAAHAATVHSVKALVAACRLIVPRVQERLCARASSQPALLLVWCGVSLSNAGALDTASF